MSASIQYTHFFLQEHVYKNIEAQFGLKAKNILRTFQAHFCIQNSKNLLLMVLLVPYGTHQPRPEGSGLITFETNIYGVSYL